MDWYRYIAWVAILLQVVFSFQCYRNYRYALAKYKKKRSRHHLRVALIVPCKGLDPDFQENIASLFNQDYENYLLCFVVEDESDPAYNELYKLKDQLGILLRENRR
jgi:cellulose synthase/poly-beta-1,6-N-acetylglucosamine synthase-like glycosyltransferase